MLRCIWLLLFIVLVFSFTPRQALTSKGQLGDPTYRSQHAHYFAWDAAHPFKALKTDNSESTQICIFCHTPHGASTVSESKLWNRGDPETSSFPLYGDAQGRNSAALIYNTTAKSLSQYYNTATYPNGASRLCMSCHDGVSAIGKILNDDGGGEGIPMSVGGERISDAGGGYNSAIIDLALSHPISFIYNTAVMQAINDHDTDGNVFQLPSDPSMTPLDSQSRMQCTTCHDPHYDTRLASSNDSNLPMWRYISGPTPGDPADYDPVCVNCHLGTDYWDYTTPGYNSHTIQ